MCQPFLSVYVDAIKNGWTTTRPSTNVNKLARKSDLVDSTLINQVDLCCTQLEAITMDEIVSAKSDLFALLTSSDMDVSSKKRQLTKKKQKIASWSSDMNTTRGKILRSGTSPMHNFRKWQRCVWMIISSIKMTWRLWVC